MNMTTPILYACEVDGSGRGLILEDEKIVGKLESSDLAWVHLDASHDDTRGWLETNIDYLDHFILDALLAPESRPRVIEHGEGMLVILRGVNLNEDSEPEDMISIRIWIDPNRIISTRRRHLRAIDDLKESFAKGQGPQNAGDFLCAVCDRLFKRMEPVLTELDDRTDDIEEKIIEKPDGTFRHDITDIRKKAIMLRRYIAPQKDVLNALKSSEINWLAPHNKRHLRESLDRVTRYIEDLDAIRERAQIVKDELANIMADRMNKNMYVLSVVAAVFLPLGFLTGLLGINVGGMPGADYEMAFWIVCGLCVAAGAGLLGLFKLLKWI